MKIVTVKESEDTYFVNNSISVAKISGAKGYDEVQEWIADGGIIEKECSDEELLKKLKTKKILKLKENKSAALDKQIYTVNIADKGDCSFYLKTSDLAVIQARISSLSNDTATKSWGCVGGRRIELNKAAFQSLLKHINANDETVYNLYAEKLEEIESVVIDGDYINDDNQPITAFQYLENININFGAE